MARVRARLPAWESCGAPPQHLSWLRDGYRLPFGPGGPPEPFHLGCSLASSLSASGAERDFLRSELQRLLSRGAIEPGQSGRFVSRAFLIPKPGQPGKWRLVFDLRHLNSFLVESPCRYETLKTARGMFEEGDWMFSLDLEDGYYAVPIAEEHRHFLTFEVAGLGLFQFAALPMGLAPSALVFTKVMSTFVRALRSPMEALSDFEARSPPAGRYVPPARRSPTLRSLVPRFASTMRAGLRCLPYVDDFLILARSFEDALAARDYVDALLELLGLRRNPRKGVWEPTQHLQHLGLGVDTLAMTFFVPLPRREKLAAAAAGLLATANSSSGLVGKRRLAGTAGLLASCTLAMPLARHYLRALYDALSTEPRWDARVRLSGEARRSLEWLLRLPDRHACRPITPLAASAEVWTDASLSGWGAVCLVGGRLTEAHGQWAPRERLLHINLLEMRAKRLALLSFAPLLQRRHVHFRGDNLVVTHVAASGTSRSPELMSETRLLFADLDSLHVTTTESWLSSTDNARADQLSRLRDEGPLLRASVADSLLARFGPHTVDRFASSDNALLPRFNSARPTPLGSGVDAFAQVDWGVGRSWCHPPWHLLPRLALFLRQTGAAATVVAPDWPGRAWYQSLRELASTQLRLPPRRAPYAPGQGASQFGCVIFQVPARARAPP